MRAYRVVCSGWPLWKGAVPTISSGKKERIIAGRDHVVCAEPIRTDSSPLTAKVPGKKPRISRSILESQMLACE